MIFVFLKLARLLCAVEWALSGRLFGSNSGRSGGANGDDSNRWAPPITPSPWSFLKSDDGAASMLRPLKVDSKGSD